MRAALILTTAATFLAHALFGCCWHHAHGAADVWDGRHSAESPVTACSHESCGHSHASPERDMAGDDDVPVPEHDSHNCDEPWCIFVTTAKLPSIEAPTVSWLAISGDLAPPLDSAKLAQSNHPTPVQRIGADSLRSHLALGVMRI